MLFEHLKQLERSSIERHIPIIGPLKGRWLLDKVLEIQPQHILELGTANGYSGIILGSEGAELLTLEKDLNRAKEAEKNFAEFTIHGKIKIGDAIETLATLADNPKYQGYFDLIFIDFAKKKYLTVLEMCYLLVKEGGYIIADNITAEGCQDFKDVIMNDNRLETEIIDIQDGLSCSRKR